MSTQVMSELAHPSEVAQGLRRSTATVKRWARNRQIDAVRLPGGASRGLEVRRLYVRRDCANRPPERRPVGMAR